MNRRAQPAFTIRSSRAVDRLKILTRGGRSQVEVVEEALERMPTPPLGDATINGRRAELDEILGRIAAQPRRYPSMAEFDAQEYDEDGNLR